MIDLINLYTMKLRVSFCLIALSIFLVSHKALAIRGETCEDRGLTEIYHLDFSEVDALERFLQDFELKNHSTNDPGRSTEVVSTDFVDADDIDEDLTIFGYLRSQDYTISLTNLPSHRKLVGFISNSIVEEMEMRLEMVQTVHFCSSTCG